MSINKMLSHVMFMAGADKKGGSSSWDKAVAKVEGKDAAGGLDTTKVDADGSAAMIQKYSKEELAQLLADQGMEWAPQNRTLEVGDMIRGTLEGYGPDAVFEDIDKVTKETRVRTVHTWIISNGNMRASILSSVQLDRKLPPFIGGQVTIVRGENIELDGGHRCADYLVGGTKLPDGKRRQFAALAAKAEAPALPPGTVDANPAPATATAAG